MNLLELIGIVTLTCWELKILYGLIMMVDASKRIDRREGRR